MARLKNNYIKTPLALATALVLLSYGAAAAVEVTVSADNEKWLISDRLVGMHHLYTEDVDSVYDGSIAAWASQVGIGTARYPGGSVVKYWDWENPTGVLTGDAWDPAWDPTFNKDASQWMGLDEYISFVNASGISPMFGVNSLSGYEFNRQQDSIDRAVRMVEYVLAQGHGGAIWYIGNEEEFQHGSIADYAQTFKAHAEAMKAADPTILIFWNNNGATVSHITEFLANDGGSADGLETHGKWPYGGDPVLANGTFAEWTVEVPLLDRKNSRAWRDAANSYRATAKSLGRPGLLISNNEYGMGKSKNYDGFDQYSKGLLLTDMMQEFVLGNWYTAAYWSNLRGTSPEDALINHQQNYRMNPVHLGLGLLANAQGTMLVESSSDHLQVYGFTAKTADEVTVYLLNKSQVAQPVNISVAGVDLDYSNAAVATTMVDTVDKWGEYVTTAITYAVVSDKFTGTLPALSYTQIKIPRSDGQLQTLPPAVIGLNATGGSTQVQLDWTTPSMNDFAEYRVYRRINPNAPFDLLATNLTASTYLDTDVINDINYNYQVVTVDTDDQESVITQVVAMPELESNFLNANFNASSIEVDTNATNLNTGTSYGNWSNIPVAGVHIDGAAGSKAMRADQIAGGLDIYANLASSQNIDLLNIDLKVAIRRIGSGHSKNVTIAGVDSAGNKSFELVLSANRDTGARKKLYYVDPVNGLTLVPESLDDDLQFMNDTFDASLLRQITLELSSAGYVIKFDDGAWTSALLPYSGTATTLDKLHFSGASTVGIWLDAISVKNN
jgi:hypothetical protein